MQSEFKLIESFKKLIPRKLQGPLGIGDDAAALPKIGPDREWIISTDVVADGVDFHIGKISPAMAGRKALAVNLSDIAAMGGIPSAFVISLGIPAHLKENWLKDFYRGMIKLAKRYSVSCVGGDISRASKFFASITILGHVKKGRAITRRGAKSGDLIYVTGQLGGSILRHHYEFVPRLEEARFLADQFHPTSMIDISDGFLQDLGHILKNSRVGAQIDLNHIPVSADARRLVRGNSQKALQHALTDGEDFELLFTIPASKGARLERIWKKHFGRISLSRVGEINSHQGTLGYVSGGRKTKLHFAKKGFSHF
ncbi:MAG: thiamine-monophosphate kinase [Candidatus Omnitrophica bacterium]|nr:thiamine-monophosphate kinase [Candidatus Omnitrophota bacterium]